MDSHHVSFAFLRSALLCLRGSDCTRTAPLNITVNDGKFTGLCWLLSPELKQLGDLPVSTVEELIFPEREFLALSTAAEQLEFIDKN